MARKKPLPEEPQDNQNNEYTAEDIQVLGGREAVRRRPGMYIGGTDQRGLHHLVYEITYNSIDEAMAGHCTEIVVTLKEDGATCWGKVWRASLSGIGWVTWRRCFGSKCTFLLALLLCLA